MDHTFSFQNKNVLHVFVNFRFTETIDLYVPDPVVHKHTPYVIILVKMADEWAKSHGGRLPSTRDEKREFKVDIILSASTTYVLYWPSIA